MQQRGEGMAVTRIAVLDIGSYELKLEIFEINKEVITSIDCVRHILALGKETYTTGKISYESLDEICGVIEGFCRIMKTYQVEDYRAYSGSAIREASNSTIVLDQIKVRTGIEVRVISNSEHRFLLYKGIARKNLSFFNMIEEGTAIVDVGAGSVQISLFDKGSLVTTQNIRLGSLRILELLHGIGNDVNSRALILELVDNDIDTFKKFFLKDRPIKNVIGIGDGLLYLMKKRKDSEEVTSITSEQFQNIYEKIIKMSIEEIEDYFDIPAGYATMILPSAIMYKKMMDEAKAERMWIPNVDFCDGIIADYAEKKKLICVEHDFSKDILSAARVIAKRYMTNKGHTQILEDSVCKLFDAMKKYHGLGKRERLLLQISAILHDCGKYINMGLPGDCAYNIIMSTEIIGLSHKEREMVANIVKYNTIPFPSYTEFQGKLSEKAYLVVLKLTAILRLGNAMDRSHKQKFKHMKVTVKNRELIITTDTLLDITLESGLLESKAKFFEEVYGIRPVLKKRKGV